MFQLAEEKKFWQNRVTKLCREALSVEIESEEELQEYVNNIEAACLNREMIKEAHGQYNLPILAEIYFRESCKDVQDTLYVISNKLGAKKKSTLKAFAQKLINGKRSKKVTTEGVLTGYNNQVKIKLNLLKV